MIQLAKQTSPHVHLWLQSLDQDPSVDLTCVATLRNLEENPNLSKSLAIAKDLVFTGEPRLLGIAALILGQFDDPRAHAFLEVVFKHSEPRLRLVAIEAARISRGRWGLRRCISALADKDPMVQSRARELCGQYTVEEISSLIGELLDKGDTSSVSDAAEGLANLASTDYFDLMEKALESADLSTKRKLATALLGMASPEILAWTERFRARTIDPDTRRLLELVGQEMRTRPEGQAPESDRPKTHGVASESVKGDGDNGCQRKPASPGSGSPLIEPDSEPRVTEPATRSMRPMTGLQRVSFTQEDRQRICGLLKELVARGGSDLHLKAAARPCIRVEGKLRTLSDPPFSDEELSRCLSSLATPAQMDTFLSKGDLDLSIGLSGIARFRLNYLTSRGRPGMVARLIPSEVPSLSELNLPQAVATLSLQTRGLLLVTGPTGSGKSTTLAAMLDLINSTRKGHIVTLEDPLEFVHRDKLCTVTQREVGSDVASFVEGIGFAQRMDPDVIFVGELRDLDTIQTTFQAASAGRLVLATLHTSSATKTIEWIIGAFPADAQAQARGSLASSLLGVISQTLVGHLRGGRVPVHEILVATSGIRKAIRESRSSSIYAQIEAGSSQGMITLEQSLARLVKTGQVSREEALARASDPSLLSTQFM